MEIIAEINNIVFELRKQFPGLGQPTQLELYNMAIQIQRNRILSEANVLTKY